ncbi:MAG: type II CAAX endopeptidase family protein [Mariprofundaceae bacterium]
MLLIGIISLESSALFWVVNVSDELVLRTMELLWLVCALHYFGQLSSIMVAKPDFHAIKVFLLLAVPCTAFAATLFFFNFIPVGMLFLPIGIVSPVGLPLLLLIGPLYEEILFRGIIYSFLRRECGIFLSILISTLLFAFAHGGAPIAQAVGGLIFVVAYEWSRNLWVAIALHVGANLGVLSLSLLSSV